MTKLSWAQQAERGLLGLFIVLLVWLPLPLGSNRHWAAALFVALVWLLLAACGLLRLATRPAPGQVARTSWGNHVVLALLVMFTAWTSLQLTDRGYTEDPHETRLYVLRCIGYVGAFWLVQLLVTSDRRRMLLLGGVLAAGVVQALIAMVLFSAASQYELMGSLFKQGTRATGTLPQADALANYMLLTISAGIAVMLAQMGHPSPPQSGKKAHAARRVHAAIEFLMSGKMLVRLMLIVMVIALVLTRSRMGNGTFFICLFFVAAWVMLRSPKLRKSAGILVVSLLVVDLIIIGQWVGLSKVLNRMEATEIAAQAASATAPLDPTAPRQRSAHREETLEERMRPVRDAMAMVRERPWTGFGGGTFYNAFTRYKVESLPLPYNHAHNDYVEIAVDVGLTGLLLLAGVALLTLGRVAQLMSDRSSPHVRGVAVGVGMGLMCALLHALVDLNLQINANAMTLTVLLAAVWSVPTQRPTSSNRSR